MKNRIKYRLDSELFLSGPVSHIPNQQVSMYDPLHNEFLDRDLFNEERNWSLLFFYPADFSHICPTELTKLNSLYAAFHAEGAELLVISRDSLLVHKKRVEIDPQLKNFKIKMVSDKDAILGKNLGLLNATTGEYERALFVCSPQGKVAYFEILNVSIGRNIEEVLRIVQGLNHLLRHPERICQEGRKEGEIGISTTSEDKKNIAHTEL